jgi:hypothetical protein
MFVVLLQLFAASGVRWKPCHGETATSGSGATGPILHSATLRRQNAAYPKAAAEAKKDGKPWRCSRLRQIKYLNNIVEQNHRNVKRLTSPGLGFGSFWTARRTLAGYEAMAMIRKGQVRSIGGRNIKAQPRFIARLFEMAL